MQSKTIYDFTVKAADGRDVPMVQYIGKVLLIVNTATQCGFTPQYKGLQKLYERYNNLGFEVLDFPCNQFMHQSPLDEAGIKSFCELKYHTTFPLFAKIDVNGKNASPLYTFLKEQQKGFLSQSIKWNFTKFLVDRNGNVVARFAPTTTPEQIAQYIEKYL